MTMPDLPDRAAARRQRGDAWEWEGAANGQTVRAMTDDPDREFEVRPVRGGAELVDSETGDVVARTVLRGGHL